jgi:hypothetical protein
VQRCTCTCPCDTLSASRHHVKKYCSVTDSPL